jgi:hypothetical protein
VSCLLHSGKPVQLVAVLLLVLVYWSRIFKHMDYNNNKDCALL